MSNRGEERRKGERRASEDRRKENLPVETIGVSGFGGSVQRNIASHRYRESLKKDINMEQIGYRQTLP